MILLNGCKQSQREAHFEVTNQLKLIEKEKEYREH